MARSRNLSIGLTILLVSAGILYLLYRNAGPTYHWRQDYLSQNKGPYGTYVISELLLHAFPEYPSRKLENALAEALPIGSDTAFNYVLIGLTPFFDSADVERLLQFVGEGNRAFLSVNSLLPDTEEALSWALCKSLPDDNYFAFPDSSVRIGLRGQERSFPLTFLGKEGIQTYAWDYLPDTYFCPSDILGYLNDTFPNFIRVEYGRGTFFLHTTPLAFSNIQLLDSNLLDYAEEVFEVLLPGPVLWDDLSKIPEGFRRTDRTPSTRGLSDRSPLEYILSQPPLAWAWYLLLLMGVFYLIFRTKRRQRPIPVVSGYQNTSLEFVRNIGRLNFLQNDHRKPARQQMQFFLNYLRRHYRIEDRPDNPAFAAVVAERSGLPEAGIRRILEAFEKIQSGHFVSGQALINFHSLLEDFYEKCK